MKKIVAICFVLLVHTAIYSQPTIVVPTITGAIPGSTVTVCIQFLNFTTVSSLNLELVFDPTVLDFQNCTFPLQSMQGGFNVGNSDDSTFYYAYFGLEPIDTINGIVVCINFLFMGGTSTLIPLPIPGVTIIPGSVSSLVAGLPESTINNQELKISPNPFPAGSGELTIQAPEGIYQLEIFNGIGSSVMEERITIGSDGILRHPGFSLKPGQYWIRLRNNQNLLSSKLLIY
jgi:hypothetical protein